ncbi:DUF6248 family natural product biosynthesis protein [Actinacidiphila glaucinigra]|uniref:DUF6248 family natural product biosynthesis protein n=1 Tax=Actinacidiphila glaucinigra TaxID=235986 RepID=UPI00367C4A63
MIETEPAELTAQACVQVAWQAATLATAAADEAMEAVCRSRASDTSRLEKTMHAAHREAEEAERYAGWVTREAAHETAQPGVLANFARQAIEHAVAAQGAAGVEPTAAALQEALTPQLTLAERASRERAEREREAEREAEERAATGMDADNRRLAFMNRHFAEQAVPALGWTAGHVRVLEVAASGCLYWRNGQAWQASKPGQWDGGRKVNKERTRQLHRAGYLTVRQDEAARALTPSPMGAVALELVRLHPDGLYADESAAYEARYARAARSWMSSDEKKAYARPLPSLDASALRLYRRPVTLAEQEARAERDAVDEWEGEGGHCPGVQTPRPAAEPVPVPVAMSGGQQQLLRRLFAPRADRERQQPTPVQTVIRRPQRTLTPADWEIVRDTALLNLQGALIMGIVDPVPNPSPMTEEEGAWVRDHAWPGHFTGIERKYPWGFRRWSQCERGTCWNCLSNCCDLCVHRQKGGPDIDDNADWVQGLRGESVAKLILRPGGEPCVWWCRCPCPKDGPAERRSRRRARVPAAPPAPAPANAGPATVGTRRSEAVEAQPALF